MSWCASVPWQPRRPGLPSDRGAPGSLVGTTFATFGCVRQERAMSTQITSPGASPRSKAARPGYAENCQHPAISAESCCSAGLAVAQGSAVHYQCRAAAHHHGGAGQRAGPGRDLRWSAAGRRGPPARRRKGASPGPGCPAGRCRLRGTPGGAAAGGTWTANRKEEALSCPASSRDRRHEGSPGSVRALRYAETLARAHQATLVPVLAWEPPGGDRADRVQPPSVYLRQAWRDAACQRLRDALSAVWGEVPDDPMVQPRVERGRPVGPGQHRLLPTTCWS